MNIEYAMVGTKFTILYDEDGWMSVEYPSLQPIKQNITNNGDILMTLPEDIYMLIGEDNNRAFMRIHVAQPNICELTFCVESAQSEIVFYSEQNILVVDDLSMNFSDANVTVLGSNTFSILLTNIDTEIIIQKYVPVISKNTVFHIMSVPTIINVGERLPEVSIEFDSSIQTYKELPCLPTGDVTVTVMSDNLDLTGAKLQIRRTNSKGIIGAPDSISILGYQASYAVSQSDDINTFDGPALFDVYAAVTINDALPCKAKIDTSDDTNMVVTYDDPTLY